MHRVRTAGVLLSFTLITSCSGSSSADETTTTSQVTTSTTTTTLPPLVSNLDVRIDPNSPDAKLAEPVLKTFDYIERRFPVKPGTIVLLYSQKDESIAWALQTAKDVNCLTNFDENRFRFSLGNSDACGLTVKLDGRPVCDEIKLCRTLVTIAANEYFQATVLQKLGTLPDNAPLWMLEGTAAYVGYSYTYFDTPGVLTSRYVEQLRQNLKEKSRVPEINVSFGEMNKLWWGKGPSPLPPASFVYLFYRAFLAVSFLVEKYGEQAVLIDYMDNYAETRDHQAAFTKTFGITEDDFYQEFQSWIDAL